MLNRPQSATKATWPQGVAVQKTAPVRPPPSQPTGSEHTMSADRSQVEDFQLNSVRVNWQLKAILPVGSFYWPGCSSSFSRPYLCATRTATLC